MKKQTGPNILISAVDQLTDELCRTLDGLPEPERITALNSVRQRLHQVSPFRDEPVDCVSWIPADQVQGNDYNPNTVAPPEMRLLALSIEADGYTQPIVAWPDDGHYTVVDGFHRRRVGTENRRIRDRVKGYLPVVKIRPDRTGRSDRMAATIRHNRARGVHGVVPMTSLVAALIQAGLSDELVARQLGMDADELLRFKQTCGLPDLFKRHPYSRAWEGDPGEISEEGQATSKNGN